MRFIMQPAIFILLATLFSATEAINRLSYNYDALQWLTPDDKARCLVNVTNNAVDSDTCYNLVNCILSLLPPYAGLGFSSGTSLLSLVPAFLSLIPTDAPGVEEAIGIGWIFALLAAFGGYLTSGKASKQFADFLKSENEPSEKKKIKEFEDDALLRASVGRGWGDEKSEVKFDASGPLRLLLYSLVIGMAGVLIYLTVILGLRTLVTWACNHDLLHIGWLFARMFPYIVEFSLLKCLRLYLQHNPAAKKTFKESETSVAWCLAQGIRGFSLMLTGLVIVYGTALMGSTNLIDGATVIWEYLLLYPVLFCSMQTILSVCALRSKRENLLDSELQRVDRSALLS